MDPSSRYRDKIGIRRIPIPETKEELIQIQNNLQHPKRGVETTRKLDSHEVHRQAFHGQNLVTWVMQYLHCTSRPSAVNISQHLLNKGIFKSLSHPNQLGGEFKDSAQSWYCFAEDDFDKYIATLPEKQFSYVHSLIIGPLGLRTTNDPTRPLPKYQLIGWLLKRFIDLKNRSESARFVALLVEKGYLIPTGDNNDAFLVRPITETTTPNAKSNTNGSSSSVNSFIDNVPLDTCSICKHFTAILSFQPEVTLACGHTFHRVCLSALHSDEMGRCTDCDGNISTIKTNTELDLILPFITKILGSPNYDFKFEIDKLVNDFNSKYSDLLNSEKKKDPKSILHLSLEEISKFIGKLNDTVLEDLRLLQKHEHGRERCLLILKKYIIPKVFGSLFPIYVKVNKDKDKALSEKIELLKKFTTPETLDIKPKFRLMDTAKPPAPLLAQSSKLLSTSSSALTSPITSIGLSTPPSGISKTMSRRQHVPTTPISRRTDGIEGEDSSSSNIETVPYQMAIDEFNRLLDYTDIYDKLNCIILTRHYIADSVLAFWKNSTTNLDDLQMDTDELMLVFTYVIIRSQIPNLFAELNFIDDFIDELSLKDEAGYCVTVVQTSIMYIHDSLSTSPSLAVDNKIK